MKLVAYVQVAGLKVGGFTVSTLCVACRLRVDFSCPAPEPSIPEAAYCFLKSVPQPDTRCVTAAV